MIKLKITGKGEAYEHEHVHSLVNNSLCKITINGKEVTLDSFKVIVRSGANVVQSKVNVQEKVNNNEKD